MMYGFAVLYVIEMGTPNFNLEAVLGFLNLEQGLIEFDGLTVFD